MKRGVVKFFNESQKFGFVICDEDKQEYYVHIKDLIVPVVAGDRVSFELLASRKGMKAVKVSKET